MPAKGANYRSGASLARAIRTALAEAEIGPDEVDHVNAHGLSMVESDAWEARALQAVFGACRAPVPVFAAKSYMGNLAAGPLAASQPGFTILDPLAASLLGLHHGLVPATLNYEEPDPDCPVAVHTGAPRPVARPYVVKIGCTQMGQCAAVVCRICP